MNRSWLSYRGVFVWWQLKGAAKGREQQHCVECFDQWHLGFF